MGLIPPMLSIWSMGSGFAGAGTARPAAVQPAGDAVTVTVRSADAGTAFRYQDIASCFAVDSEIIMTLFLSPTTFGAGAGHASRQPTVPCDLPG